MTKSQQNNKIAYQDMKHTPSHGALLTRGARLIRLTLDACHYPQKPVSK